MNHTLISLFSTRSQLFHYSKVEVSIHYFSGCYQVTTTSELPGHNSLIIGRKLALAFVTNDQINQCNANFKLQLLQPRQWLSLPLYSTRRLLLQDCDVDLQQQGMLLLQDEFLVQKSRHKAAKRHLFLFEDLLVFAKSKKVLGAQDEYTYKSSLKVIAAFYSESKVTTSFFDKVV